MSKQRVLPPELMLSWQQDRIKELRQALINLVALCDPRDHEVIEAQVALRNSESGEG
jgi:hypothetical protein